MSKPSKAMMLKASSPPAPCLTPFDPVQAAVLLLFNDTDTLSYGDIAAATGLEAKELKRTLQSLACGKVGGPYSVPYSTVPYGRTAGARSPSLGACGHEPTLGTCLQGQQRSWCCPHRPDTPSVTYQARTPSGPRCACWLKGCNSFPPLPPHPPT